MADAFPIKQNDLAPSYAVVLTDATGFVDLELASSIKFLMRGSEKEDPAAPDVTGAMTKAKVKIKNPLKPSEEIEVWVATYDWEVGDTDQDPGLFDVEVEVTWPGSKPETFPADEEEPYLLVHILEDLG